MASSVVRAEEIDREFLQCALCIDRLQKPKVLTCQHTFCEGCLELWVAKNDNQLSCPVCRKEYQLPANGVSALPDNFFVNSIIDFIGRKRQASANAQLCNGCENEASHYCQDCEEELCFDCAGAHRRLRVTKSHKLTTLDEYQASGMRVDCDFAKQEDKMCRSHRGNPLEFFCQSCDIPICRLCMLKDHHIGQHVHISFGEAAALRRESLGTLASRAKEKVSVLRDAMMIFKETQRRLKLNRERIESQIKQRKQKMIEMIQLFEQEAAAELDEEFSSRNEKLEEAIQNQQRLLDKTLSVCNVLENLHGEGDDAALLYINRDTTWKLEESINFDATMTTDDNGFIGFNSAEDRHDRVAVFGQVQSPTMTSTSHVAIGLQPSCPPVISAGEDVCLTLTTRNAGGERVRTGGAPVTAKLCSPAGEVGIARVRDRMDGNYDITFRPNCAGKHRLILSVFGKHIGESPLEFDVEQPERQVITFGNLTTSGVNPFMADARLREPWGVAVSDRTGLVYVADTGNSCIRVFDLEGTPKGQIGFSNFPQRFEPVDLTINHQDHLVITDHRNQQVLVCSQDGSLNQIFGSAELRRPCGVAVNSLGNAYVTDHESHCVRVYDNDGAHLRDLGGYGNTWGSFRGPISAAINSKDELIVSDRDNHRLQVFDTEGDYLLEVTPSGEGEDEFKYPTGVAVDINDNIYVCNDWNGRVLKFSPDGTFLKRVDSDEDGLRYPNGIAVTEDGRVVVVDYGNDCVKVFA
ncbi:tripartite motif-containing protein 2-like [Diadema antillarum]|uniref:tripartite motif-containing protein 2-like n=1 Tax=Diadema antillarum TaxID=105358 RepID=UPI003A8B60B0